VGAIGRVADWLDDRTGYRSVVKVATEEPVPGGASFAYVFGSVLTFILILQITTGIFLAMYYSPSATDAWASVAYIQDQVTMGWFVRGLHSHGASAMVILAGFHLLQTALYGAYKKPREVNWLLGCLMLGLILAFALTGYLLPWDQTGYWATKVATGIAGSTPLVGDQLQHAVQGGNQYGNLTLTRFFAIHVFILPALMIGLVVLHIALFRKHGVTPKWGKSDDELAARTQPFWPDQMFRDMIAIVLVFAAVVVSVVVTGGASLDAPADPASNFDARPEWYFRFLFQALKYFEGPLEMVVALGLPVILGAVFFGLPFVDRSPSRDPRTRIKYLAVIGAVLAGAGALTVVSFVEDAGDADLQERLAESETRADQARELARTQGVPAAGGNAVYALAPDPRPEGRYAELGRIQALAVDLWDEHCFGCHRGDDREAPLIGVGFNSRAWIRGFLKDPDGDDYMGRVKTIQAYDKRMEPVELDGDELTAVVEFVYSLAGPPDVDAKLADQGKELFEDGSCSDCHDIVPGEKLGTGPNLAGRGSAAQLIDFIGDAGAELYYGEHNDMPAFADDLTRAERAALADLVIWFRTGPDDAR
jgi:ubiquinol-cytochrome c reductase cytochrome b subunit